MPINASGLRQLAVHVNDVLAFGLELLALWFWGRLAYRLVAHPVLRVVAAVLCVVAVAVIWGLAFSPKARYRPPDLLYYPLKFATLAVPLLPLLRTRRALAIVLLILVAVNILVQWRWGRGDWGFIAG